MPNFILKCGNCGSEYLPAKNRLLCEKCKTELINGLYVFPGILKVEYDLNRVKKTLKRDSIEKRAPGIWRYKEILPVKNPANIISLGEGNTPLLECSRLASSLGLKKLYIKNETMNPSGAFKDRETSVAVSMAKEFGFDTVACASTGTAAASLAMYSAKGGLKSIVFILEVTPLEKIIQTIFFGSKIFSIKGIYEEALKLLIWGCNYFGWYNCSAAINPYRIEGDKTIAFEICEQLKWEVPDRIVIPTGGGGNLSGQWKGFKEFFEIGLIKRLPKITAVQVEAGASLARSIQLGKHFVEPVETSETIAGSILSAYCDYGPLALKSIRESGGEAVIVTDEEILEAQKMMAEEEGVFVEPSGAASIAGLKKLIEDGAIRVDERIVCLATGTGLRDINTLKKQCIKPKSIEPSIENLLNLIKQN